MNVVFFFKMCKIACRLRKSNKNSENVYRFSDDGVSTLCEDFSQLMTKIHVIGSQCVTKQF